MQKGFLINWLASYDDESYTVPNNLILPVYRVRSEIHTE